MKNHRNTRSMEKLFLRAITNAGQKPLKFCFVKARFIFRVAPPTENNNNKNCCRPLKKVAAAAAVVGCCIVESRKKVV